MNALETARHVDILPKTVTEVPNPCRRPWELWKPQTAYVAIDSEGNGWLFVENVTTLASGRGSDDDPEHVLKAKLSLALQRTRKLFPQGTVATAEGVVADVIPEPFAPNRPKDKDGVPIFATKPGIDPRFPGRSIWIRFENTTVGK